MKKNLLFVGALISSSLSFGQTIFSENFDAALTLPAGWVLHNVDGLTPATNVNYVTDAWVPKANSVTSAGNHMVSTSWYTPAGISNDWLVTPSIAIPATGYFLNFDVMAPDATYLDGYKVYVSTTGSAVANFTSPAISTVAAAPNTYTGVSLDLSAYAGQSVYIAIVNNSNDKFLLYVDNVVVRMPSPNDAILVSSTLNRYSLVSTNNALGMSIKNDGTNAITSVTVDWNDGTSHSSVISCNIAAGATATVNHPTAVTYATALEKNLNITITNVNGTTDPNMGNNVGTKAFNTISATSTKRVVFEEGTGIWCGFCVRGAVAMEYMDLNHPDFIGIAVHNGDPMTVTAYDAGNAATLPGFPGANIDRSILGSDVDNATFEAAYLARHLLITPAGITATSTVTGSSVAINVSTTFRTPYAAANLRLAVAIVEDNVIGTDASYDQHNYYGVGGSANSSPLVDVNGFNYNTQPQTLDHTTYAFNHVARAIVGGFNGLAGSIPTTITDGQVVPTTFNYTVPAGQNINNMSAAVLLIDQVSGEIVNATEIPLTAAGISAVSKDNFNLNVYPNPASGIVNIAFEAKNNNYLVTISDLAGRSVISNNYSNLSGAQSIAVPVNEVVAGTYLVTVSTEGVSYTQQVVIK
jgi:hypothetical protein